MLETHCEIQGNYTAYIIRHQKTGTMALGIAKRNPKEDEFCGDTGLNIAFGRAILDLG